MILDDISNLAEYGGISPYFKLVADYLGSADLESLRDGHVELEGPDFYVNISTLAPKSKADAPLECHADYIDVQVPLSADEEMGFTSKENLACASVPYDKKADVSFHPGMPDTYVNVRKGMFVVFFPGEGHAPGITENGVRKLVFKIRK